MRLGAGQAEGPQEQGPGPVTKWAVKRERAAEPKSPRDARPPNTWRGLRL